MYLHDDVRTLSREILEANGALPSVILGSPPCKDTSCAKPSATGIDGAATSLWFEAVRLVDDCRPDWGFLRTSLQAEFAASTGSSLRWTVSATPAGRSWWVLTPQEHRTNGNGSGWSLPTPKARDEIDLMGATACEATRNTPSLKWRIEHSLGIHGPAEFLRLRSWMMGLPPSWLATALSIAQPAPPKAMPLSHTSPAGSSEP